MSGRSVWNSATAKDDASLTSFIASRRIRPMARASSTADTAVAICAAIAPIRAAASGPSSGKGAASSTIGGAGASSGSAAAIGSGTGAAGWGAGTGDAGRAPRVEQPRIAADLGRDGVRTGRLAHDGAADEVRHAVQQDA